MSSMMRSNASRAGMTLAELLVALVLVSVVGATIIATTVRQQRFYTDASEVMETRSSVRQAADLLSVELRALSPGSGDIYQMGIGAIEFRQVRGASVLCNIMAGHDRIVLPPVNLSRRNSLTSWSGPPEVGDSVMVFDVEASPRVWRRAEITEVTPASACLPVMNFGANVAENSAGTMIRLSWALPLSMVNGAPVRIYRRARYELYQTAARDWYLGYYDCLPTRVPNCSALQPVSGPYLPLGPVETSGIAMRYFDATGAETANPAAVARIDVVGRSASRRPVRFIDTGGAYRDSLAFSIAVRN